MVIALLLGELTLAHVLVVGFVEGTLSVFHLIAAHAAVPTVVHPDQLSLALSRNEARSQIGSATGDLESSYKETLENVECGD